MAVMGVHMLTYRRIWGLAVASIIASSLGWSEAMSAGEEKDLDCFCSIISLIANPEDYDGKRIRTEGVARIGHEDTAIYLSADSATHRITVNGIQVAVDPSKALKEKLHLKWVLIEGTYHKWQPDETRWRGYIDEITLLYAPEDMEIR